MTKKIIISIIVLFLIILILGAILILSSKPQKEEKAELDIPVESQEPQEQVTEKQLDVVKENIVIKEFDDSFLSADAKTAVPSKTDADKAELQLFVRNFLEDFGSFSFNGGYGHIEDLYDKMTAEFRAYTENWIAGDPARQLSSEFYSIQTMASDVKIGEFSSNKAKLIADATRIETKAPEYYGKRFVVKAEVNAVKIGGEWKVASVYWK